MENVVGGAVPSLEFEMSGIEAGQDMTIRHSYLRY